MLETDKPHIIVIDVLIDRIFHFASVCCFQVMEAEVISLMRTAAASAVALKVL
jgi:hypothetical protein